MTYLDQWIGKLSFLPHEQKIDAAEARAREERLDNSGVELPEEEIDGLTPQEWKILMWQLPYPFC